MDPTNKIITINTLLQELTVIRTLFHYTGFLRFLLDRVRYAPSLIDVWIEAGCWKLSSIYGVIVNETVFLRL